MNKTKIIILVENEEIQDIFYDYHPGAKYLCWIIDLSSGEVKRIYLLGHIPEIRDIIKSNKDKLNINCEYFKAEFEEELGLI